MKLLALLLFTLGLAFGLLTIAEEIRLHRFNLLHYEALR